MVKMSVETKICGILIVISIIGLIIICCMGVIVDNDNILFGLIPFIILVVISGVSYDHFLEKDMKID